MLEPHHDFDPTTDEGALVAAIRARPMDDTPKLVMADWQDDHGSPVVAAMYRHAVQGGELPPTSSLGHITAEDGLAVSRHAGVFSQVSDPKPPSTWHDDTIGRGVNSAIGVAVRAATEGPLQPPPPGMRRAWNRHAALYTSHNHLASRHGRAGNYQASKAHQYAAVVHARLAEQK
jgi:uncharacterized protein (TIGR02996 family)